MLKCVSDQILKSDKDINLFLYEFLDDISSRYVDCTKRNNDFSYESAIIFDCFISLIEEDKNMSDDAKNKINDFIITLFNPDNLLHNLKNHLGNLAFVNYLTFIIKNEKFDFYLPSQNKSFFAYIQRRFEISNK